MKHCTVFTADTSSNCFDNSSGKKTVTVASNLQNETDNNKKTANNASLFFEFEVLYALTFKFESTRANFWKLNFKL